MQLPFQTRREVERYFSGRTIKCLMTPGYNDAKASPLRTMPHLRDRQKKGHAT
jgi:hypothetical protein